MNRPVSAAPAVILIKRGADEQKGGGAVVWIILGVTVVLLGGAGVFCYFKWDLVSPWLRKIGMYFKAKTK